MECSFLYRLLDHPVFKRQDEEDENKNGSKLDDLSKHLYEIQKTSIYTRINSTTSF